MRLMFTLYLPPSIMRRVWSFFASMSFKYWASFSLGIAIDRSFGACSRMVVPPPSWPPRPCANISAAPSTTAPIVATTLMVRLLPGGISLERPAREITYAVRGRTGGPEGPSLRKPEGQNARARRHRHQLLVVEHVGHRR